MGDEKVKIQSPFAKGTLSVVLRLAERYRSQYDGEECCGSNKDGETREFIRRRQSGWIWVPGNPFKRHQGKKTVFERSAQNFVLFKNKRLLKLPFTNIPKTAIWQKAPLTIVVLGWKGVIALTDSL